MAIMANMNVEEAINKRRAYRALEKAEIEDHVLGQLVDAARLAPSCFNNQPWNFVFVRDKDMLEEMKTVMSKGNEWTYRASMIVAVFSRQEDDCNIKERHYFLFDAGQATAFMQLRATELGLVAHPIAGYSEKKVKDILGIPEGYTVITLIIFGKHSEHPERLLEGDKLKVEEKRPDRRAPEEFVHLDRF